MQDDNPLIYIIVGFISMSIFIGATVWIGNKVALAVSYLKIQTRLLQKIAEQQGVPAETIDRIYKLD